MEELERRLERIIFHQQLIAESLGDMHAFTKLVILKDLSEEEVRGFFQLCDELNKEMQEQKAEGFVYFHPLLKKWREKLNRKLDPEGTIHACLLQGIYQELMVELARIYHD